LYDLADFVVDARWDGHITHYPWLVLYRWHLYWRKEVLSEVTALFVVPREAVLVYAHEIMHEITFCWPKEVVGMDLVDILLALKGVSASGLKRRRTGGK
jgi:hypothetical protein